jgi:hypothetical protein
MSPFAFGVVCGILGTIAVLGIGMAIIGFADMVASKRAEGGRP